MKRNAPCRREHPPCGEHAEIQPERMASRGYISQLKLDADRFGVQKYLKELEVAEVKLEVLRTYTKAKTLKKHESDINTSKAKVAAETAKHEIEADKLAQIGKPTGEVRHQGPH